MKTGESEEELLKLEKAFAEAIVRNDLKAIGRLVTDDWIIIDPKGEIVDRARFFEVIKSGTLTHEMMDPKISGSAFMETPQWLPR
jgi:ketosteroid isomerase-like protein